MHTRTQSATGPATSSAPDYSPAALARRALERRAVEAVNWAMPAVNFQLMYDAVERDVKRGPGGNKVVYWSHFLDWKNQTLTPNPDAIYLMPFYDTREGPVVLEVPAADAGHRIVGSIDDGWQTALEDVGPAGVDKGKGGKYLILPPGYKDKVPDGYFPLQSSTYMGFALLRSNPKSGSDADVAAAVAYGKSVRFHPLGKDAASTSFIDAADAGLDATIPYDIRFFEALDRFVQREPWLERDRAMIDILRFIGIEKGKPFKPGPEAKAALEAGILEAQAWMDSIYDEWFPPFFEGTHWALPTTEEVVRGIGSNYTEPDSYPIDNRGRLYSYIFFSMKHIGAGQYYLMEITDKGGNRLDGSKDYRLTIPANPPVEQYWSATLYDRATHALIKDTSWSSRASTTPGLQQNADGSVDIWFGPAAPAGKESNWVPTKEGGEFEVLFRFYGPTKALFEKAWVLPDIERAEA